VRWRRALSEQIVQPGIFAEQELAGAGLDVKKEERLLFVHKK
jgi:hypothetical protein